MGIVGRNQLSGNWNGGQRCHALFPLRGKRRIGDRFFILAHPADLRESAAALRKGRLASEDCGDAGLGIDDAAAGEGRAEEAAYVP